LALIRQLGGSAQGQGGTAEGGTAENVEASGTEQAKSSVHGGREDAEEALQDLYLRCF